MNAINSTTDNSTSLADRYNNPQDQASPAPQQKLTHLTHRSKDQSFPAIFTQNEQRSDKRKRMSKLSVLLHLASTTLHHSTEPQT